MKNSIMTLITTLATTILLSSCGISSQEEISSKYKLITIGKQVWMAENLKVDKLRNGDAIPEAETIEEWVKASENKIPAWCYYNNDPSNDLKYGKLYNGYAVTDPRGLCPSGWHIPSDAEWTSLTDNLGGNDVAGGKIKNTSGWENDGGGTNESGFAGLPGGARSSDGVGIFSMLGFAGFWWTSTEVSINVLWMRSVNAYNGGLYKEDYDKQRGYSVRCLKD